MSTNQGREIVSRAEHTPSGRVACCKHVGSCCRDMRYALWASGVTDGAVHVRQFLHAEHSRHPSFLGTGHGASGPVVLVRDGGCNVADSDHHHGEHVPIAVEIVGEARALGYQSAAWPALCGDSLGGRVNGETGTYGFRVRQVVGTDAEGDMCLLSNAHVFAYDQQGRTAPTGSPIDQPGGADAQGQPQRTVGFLHDFVPLQFAGRNRVDAALAQTAAHQCAARWHGLGPIDPTPLPIDQLRIGTPVVKEGRTTGRTFGAIQYLDIQVNVNYGPPGGADLVAGFEGQIQIASDGPFSLPGDSGSGVLALVEGVYRPVALLFSGNGSTATWATPIDEVMRALSLANLQYAPDEGT